MGNRFNLEYDIPSNKIVTIENANGSIFPQPLIFDDEFSIKVKSNYGELWEASPNNFLNLLSGSTDGKIPSGQFALQGAQIWKSTDPIDISIKVSLEMDKDPFLDVVEPTITLMSASLPKKSGQVGFFGNWISATSNLQLETLIPPGPNIQSLVNLMKNNKAIGSNLLDNSLGENGTKGVYNIKIGFVKFFNVIITGVEPTFSKTYAPSLTKDNKLFPISSELSLDFRTMEIATTDMLKAINDAF